MKTNRSRFFKYLAPKKLLNQLFSRQKNSSALEMILHDKLVGWSFGRISAQIDQLDDCGDHFLSWPSCFNCLSTRLDLVQVKVLIHVGVNFSLVVLVCVNTLAVQVRINAGSALKSVLVSSLVRDLYQNNQVLRK